jgi:hypothetical protein
MLSNLHLASTKNTKGFSYFDNENRGYFCKNVNYIGTKREKA